MRGLAERDLLDIWERGADLHPVDRSLLALHAAFPAISYGTLAGWPLGARNRALAELLGSWFGPQLEAQTSCDACGEQLEFEMDTRVLTTGFPAPAPGEPAPAPGEPGSAAREPGSAVAVTVGPHSFRLPSSRDLALAAREPATELAAAALLRACWIGDGAAPSFSGPEIDEAGERLALADPLAEMLVRLACPGCGREWDDALDLAQFLWAGVEARARRLLQDVHDLARAYGWTEEDTLRLSERRRRFYIDAAYP